MHRMFAQINAFSKNTRTILFTAIGLLAFCSAIPMAHATPMGNLAIAGCAAAGVNVNANSITWLGSPGGLAQAGYGCVNTTSGGLGTNLTYSGGTLSSGVNGEIKSLVLSPPTSGIDFMDFTGNPNLIFDLAGFLPGPASTSCGTLALFQSCAVAAGSPFVLELDPGGTGLCPAGVGGGNNCQTKISLNIANSVVRDLGNGSSALWTGSFSTQIPTMSPSQIQSAIIAGATIGSSEAGAFTLFTVPVPEPVTFVMIGGGLIGLAMLRRRKKPV